MRPTAESLGRSLEILSKKHLFLTGRRGAGKSTLLAQLFSGTPALRTLARPGEGVWLEGPGRTLQVGRYAPDTPGISGGMVPLPGGFEEGGVAALEACAAAKGEWAVLDEVGYLEKDCPRYLAALDSLLEKKRVAAVLRKEDLPHLNALLARPDAWVVDLDQPFPALGWVVMASGRGERFGSNKLMAPLGGKPLLAHVLERGKPLFPRGVVVTRWPETAALARQMGMGTVLHHQPDRSDTVRLGLEALGPGLTGYLFSPGDQPLVTAGTLQVLALCAGACSHQIWRLAFGDTPGAPIYFPGEYYPALTALTGKEGGGALAKKNPRQVSYIPVREEWELWDVDRPQDLERLEQVFARSGE